MARHSRPAAAAAAVLLMASSTTTSAEYIHVAPNGRPFSESDDPWRSPDTWTALGDGCNQAGGDCQPIVYDDIRAEVGDILVFRYQQFHDVFLHDSVDAGMACNMGEGSTVGANNGGYRTDGDRVGFQFELTEAGSFVFSCSRSGNNPAWPAIGGHCQNGQKVRVNVGGMDYPIGE